MDYARPNPSADGFFSGLLFDRRARANRCIWKKPHALGTQLNQRCRNEEERESAGLLHETGSDRSAHDCAQRAPNADKTKQALALVGVKDVHHESPEHGDHKKIEDTGPDKKSAPDPDLITFGEC